MKRISELEQAIEYSFRNKMLAVEAITHTSYANEKKRSKLKDGLQSVNHNERLEFLGDSVLNLVITTYIFQKLKKVSEGEMSRIRSSIVCEKSLRSSAESFSLPQYLLLGKGEDQTGGRQRDSIIADAMEALIGAIYLDSGIDEARKFIMHYMEEVIYLAIQGKLFKDYKTQFQEMVQKNNGSRIEYKVVDESGPDHNKLFVVQLVVDGKKLSLGSGRNKKEAEQNAAKEAIHVE